VSVGGRDGQVLWIDALERDRRCSPWLGQW
jgi:hypothetical protein